MPEPLTAEQIERIKATHLAREAPGVPWAARLVAAVVDDVLALERPVDTPTQAAGRLDRERARTVLTDFGVGVLLERYQDQGAVLDALEACIVTTDGAAS